MRVDYIAKVSIYDWFDLWIILLPTYVFTGCVPVHMCISGYHILLDPRFARFIPPMPNAWLRLQMRTLLAVRWEVQVEGDKLMTVR